MKQSTCSIQECPRDLQSSRLTSESVRPVSHPALQLACRCVGPASAVMPCTLSAVRRALKADHLHPLVHGLQAPKVPFVHGLQASKVPFVHGLQASQGTKASPGWRAGSRQAWQQFRPWPACAGPRSRPPCPRSRSRSHPHPPAQRRTLLPPPGAPAIAQPLEHHCPYGRNGASKEGIWGLDRPVSAAGERGWEVAALQSARLRLGGCTASIWMSDRSQHVGHGQKPSWTGGCHHRARSGPTRPLASRPRVSAGRPASLGFRAYGLGFRV